MAVDLKEVEQQADDLGLTGEQRTQFLSIFQHDETFGKLKARGLRQSEFDRKMDEGKKATKTALDEYQQKMADLTEQMDALGRLRTDTAAEVDRVRKESESIQTKAFQAEQALRRVATDAGLNPDEYLKSIGHEPVADTTKKQEPAFDTSKFVDSKRFGDGIRTSVMTTAALMKVSNEHRKLFGKDLEDPEELVNYVIDQGAKGRDLTIQQAWEERNKVHEKREEVRNADVDRRIAEARTEGEIKARSEMAIGRPGAGVQRSESPALMLNSGKSGGRGQVSEHLLGSAQRLAEARARIATGQS